MLAMYMSSQQRKYEATVNKYLGRTEVWEHAFFGRLNLKCVKATSMSCVCSKTMSRANNRWRRCSTHMCCFLYGQHVHVRLVWCGWNMEGVEGSGLAFVSGHL
jgi:hypothetical protein